MEKKVFDLFHNEIKVGNEVVWPIMTSTRNGTLEHGIVVSIKKCPVITKIVCRIIKSGAYCYREGIFKTFHFPSTYPKLVRL